MMKHFKRHGKFGIYAILAEDEQIADEIFLAIENAAEAESQIRESLQDLRRKAAAITIGKVYSPTVGVEVLAIKEGGRVLFCIVDGGTKGVFYIDDQPSAIVKADELTTDFAP